MLQDFLDFFLGGGGWGNQRNSTKTCYYVVTLTQPVSISFFRLQTQFSFSLDLNTLRLRVRERLKQFFFVFFKLGQGGQYLYYKKLVSQLTTKTGHTSSACEVG